MSLSILSKYSLPVCNAFLKSMMGSRTVEKLNVVVSAELQFCFLPRDGTCVLIKQRTDLSSLWLILQGLCLLISERLNYIKLPVLTLL